MADDTRPIDPTCDCMVYFDSFGFLVISSLHFKETHYASASSFTTLGLQELY